MDNHQAKLKFLQHITKQGLAAFADGGTTQAPGTVLPTGTVGATQNAVNPNVGVAGTIGSLLGLNNNFQASSANLTPGTNTAQINAAYTGAQNALTGQQNLATTLAPQAGTAAANQNTLANQLLGMTQGTGPNPALTQLNQTTGTNVANQAALMAGQRGASANPALIARQAAQQGAATQQGAVGQAATLEAQQQIAAQQALSNLAANQIAQTGQATTNLTSAQQGEQNILQGANTSLNNALVGMQSNINNVNAQTAAANQQTAGGIIGGVLGGASSLLSHLFKGGGEVTKDKYAELRVKLAKGGPVKKGYMQAFANGTYEPIDPNNDPFAAQPSPVPATSSKLAAPAASAPQSFIGKFLKAPMPAPSAATGSTPSPAPAASSNASSPYAAGQDFVNNLFNAIGRSGSSSSDQATARQIELATNQASSTEDGETTYGNTGTAGTLQPASNAPNTIDFTAAKGGMASRKRLASSGGPVKANSSKEKAVKKGNSYDNDKIPALLSQGEIVLPRTVTMHPNAPEKAAKFVMHVLANKKARGRA